MNHHGLKNKFKIAEKGMITRQEIEYYESGETIFSYLGTEKHASLPGNIKIGDTVLVEHIINKNNVKVIYMRAEKI